jgi:hypothetical protein
MISKQNSDKGFEVSINIFQQEGKGYKKSSGNLPTSISDLQGNN